MFLACCSKTLNLGAVKAGGNKGCGGVVLEKLSGGVVVWC